MDRKVTLLTVKDVYQMRIGVINRLMDVLLDYGKLPDIDKDEKRQITESIRELKESVDDIRELLL